MIVRLQFQKRSALKFVSQTIPEAKRMGLDSTIYNP